MEIIRDNAVIELTRWPLDRLMLLAWRHGIICDYYVTPRLVGLDDGEAVVRLDPEQARYYLCGLIRGHLPGSARFAGGEMDPGKGSGLRLSKTSAGAESVFVPGRTGSGA